MRYAEEQPAGLQDSSRWSSDHRIPVIYLVRTLKRGARLAQRFLAPLFRVPTRIFTHTGGLRCASTSGYSLSTLRVELTTRGLYGVSRVC